MSESKRPKAIAVGKLFEEFGAGVDCYVLEGGRRVISQAGIIRALRSGGKSHGDKESHLDRYIARLPSRFAHLAMGPAVEFELPQGGATAIGRDAQFFVDLLKAYSSAYRAGELHASQEKLAMASIAIIEALAGVGIEALIDEATGYERSKAERERARLFAALFRDNIADWTLRWPPPLVRALSSLYRVSYIAGSPPRALQTPFHVIYTMIFGQEAARELKDRNPNPDSYCHHQTLTDEGSSYLSNELQVVKLLAEQSRTKDEFWARMRAHYQGEGLQLGWV